METQEQQTQVQSPESSQEPSQVSQEATSQPNSQEGVPAENPAVPQWQPSYKFKVHDKEMEFDPYFKDAIKTEEQEKRLKELYEKSHGLDLIKPKYQQTQQKYQELDTNYKNITTDLQALGNAIRTGDLDTAFNMLKMDEKAVFQWVQGKLTEMEMPEQQRNQLHQQRQEAKRAQQLEQENAILQSNWEQAQLAARERELDLSLGAADSIAKQYDAKYGEGAFRQEVIMLGAMENQMGRDPSATELVQLAVKKYSPFFQASVQAGQPQQQPQPGQKVATLPNVTGQSVSAARPKIKSIEDIKRRAAELE